MFWIIVNLPPPPPQPSDMHMPGTVSEQYDKTASSDCVCGFVAFGFILGAKWPKSKDRYFVFCLFFSFQHMKSYLSIPLCLYLRFHFSSKKSEFLDKSSSIDTLVAFFEPKWSPIVHSLYYFQHPSHCIDGAWNVNSWWYQYSGLWAVFRYHER